MAPEQEANSAAVGNLFDFLHNNCMLSVLIRIASMRKFPLNICFLELLEEFRRDSKTSSN